MNTPAYLIEQYADKAYQLYGEPESSSKLSSDHPYRTYRAKGNKRQRRIYRASKHINKGD